MSNLKSFQSQLQFQFCVGLLLVLGGQLFLSPNAFAQTDSAQQQELFQQRRSAVMEFVHQNHPEMETLLLALEESQPVKFGWAIKRIGKTLSKIKSVKENQPKRYDALVAQWKVKSEIEIVTARLAKQDSPDLRAELDDLVEKFVDNRRQLLELEKRHIEQRLERVNRMLETIDTDRDAFLKKNLRSVNKTLKQLKSNKPSKK